MREAYILRNFRETAQKSVPTVRIVEGGVGVAVSKCNVSFNTHIDPYVKMPPIACIEAVYPDNRKETFGVDRIHIVDTLPLVDEVKIRIEYAGKAYVGVLRVEGKYENLSP